MEIQFTNEISSFWHTLFLPLFFNALLILVIYLLLGKSRFLNLCETIFLKSKTKFVQKKGVYVPVEQTITNRLYSKFIGNAEINPLIKLFIFLLFIYGINQAMGFFLGAFTITQNYKVLFASVHESSIAEIWSYYPDIKSVNSLYHTIMLKYNSLGIDRYQTADISFYFDQYLRMGLIIALIFPILPINKRRRFRSMFRSICVMLLLTTILSLVYLNYMNKNNSNVEQKCYVVLSSLNNGNSKHYSEYIEYYELIEKDMIENSHKLYYGGYGVHFQLYDDLKAIFTEINRIALLKSFYPSSG